MQVGDVMTRQVVTVGPDTGLQEAARLLREHNVAGVPVVVAGGALVGMLTEGDLLRALERVDVPGYVDILGGLFAVPGPGHIERQVRDVAAYRVDQLMGRHPATAHSEDDVRAAAERMVRHRVKQMPVVDAGGRVVGIVSRSDLLRALF